MKSVLLNKPLKNDEKKIKLSNDENNKIQGKYFDLNEEYERIYKIKNEKQKNKELHDYNIKKENMNTDFFLNENNEYNYLYPHLDDPNFNIKISNKKEFNDTKYDGTIVDDFEKHSEILCNSDFEMSPHQSFVRKFLSFQTPYNSLLLYHGLGSGKTCSAINVAEEMRDYLKQMNISQRIMIIASPNVQENFKTQLFDESKLKLVDGLWNIRACTGNNFLKEINPMSMKGLSKDRVKSQINRIINASYLFIGYIQFANYVNKLTLLESDLDENKKNKIIKIKLKKIFNNRLIIIDEVHNIRSSDEKNKLVYKAISNVVENTDNLRLLLLSATPMFNNYKEIIWLINLMNKNDKRPSIQIKDVFNSDGSFIVDKNGKEIGKELLIRKATGYISFVRGENPYTFPYRIWASEINKQNSFLYDNDRNNNQENNRIRPPIIQMNDEIIPSYDQLKILPIYLVQIGEYQQNAYNYIINTYLKQQNEKRERKIKYESFDDIDNEIDNQNTFDDIDQPQNINTDLDVDFDNDIENIVSQPIIKQQKDNIEHDNDIDAVKYTDLQRPLECLNIVYPYDEFDIKKQDYSIDTKILVGNEGMSRIMNFNKSLKTNYKYKKDKPRMFSPSQIGKYSSKIKTICDNIINSTGIVLVYSQFIDGGIVPISLALEELGFTRAGSRGSLFSPDEVTKSQKKLKYITITGDKSLSPDNNSDIKLLTDIKNKDGDEIKVVLISQAGTEGIDFKYIRQVHVLDAWYNLNRIEQIIGRAVRTCSHKDLPFEKRNVEIYLYGSILSNQSKEAADIYIYRLAERKAIQIGVVSRLLKETAVDCIINSAQIGFTFENINKTVKQLLSSGKIIDYKIGDKPYTSVCDYMDNCFYSCNPNIKDQSISLDTYNKVFIMTNTDKIIQRIRDIFKERFFYKKKELIQHINAIKSYKLVEINAALNKIVEDKYEVFKDKYFREGHIVNIDDMYLFQPIELIDKHISVYDRSVPLDYKRELLNVQLPKTISESEYKPPALKRVLQKVVEKNNDILSNDNIILHKKSNIYEIINTINTNFNIATIGVKEHIKKINKKKNKELESNWYYNCYTIFKYISNNDILQKLNITIDILYNYIITHILFDLQFDDFVELLNYLYNEKREKNNKNVEDLLIRIKSLIDRNIMNKDNKKGILLIKNKIQQFKSTKKDEIIDKNIMEQLNDIGIVLVMCNNNVWDVTNKLSEYSIMRNNISTNIITKTDLKNKKLNETIGFITYFKGEDFLVFKTKKMSDKRSKGSRCDQKPSDESINILFDSIFKSVNGLYDFFTERKDKQIFENKKSICIIQEFILYIFNELKINDKIWFLDPIKSALNNIENMEYN